jgi:hypothetical protein
MGKIRGLAVLVVFWVSMFPASAGATPVCTDGYKGGPPRDLCDGRIFPEATNSTDYVQYLPDPATGFAEYQHGIEYLAQLYPRWISTFTLSGHFKDQDAVSAGPDGNRSYDADDEADGHDIFVIKITDHEVPDEGKETLLYSLSIHGDEKGGIEGGVRTAEDLAIAATEGGEISDGIAGFESTTGREPEVHSYPVSDVLKKEVVYLVDFNIDGWRRGDHFAPTPGLYTRTNQMGTDLNRQMPTVGYINPSRNPLQEPEMLYGHRFMHEVSAAGVGGQMAYGADVHGEGQSRAWADIMYPAGQFDSIKHRRLMSIAERTKSVIDATLFMGIPDLIEQETGGDSGEGIEDLGGPANTVPSKPARWGTVWDTLGYTDTGFLGDYMATELGVTGMDYEIAMNHADNTRPYGRPWGVIFQENYINATRAIIKTAMAYAMTERQDFADFQIDPVGRVGYLFNPDTITDDDEDGSGRLPGPLRDHDNNSATPTRATGVGQDGRPVEQRPYDATNMQFFEDENAYVKGGLTKALPADISSSPTYLDQFDTLMVADVYFPHDLLGRPVDRAAFFGNLKAWVQRGGNLVLTDRALHALGEMGIVPTTAVTDVKVYQPYANIADLEHSMVQGLRGNARQLSEATLIGYGIGDNASPMTVVTKAAWEDAGGHTVATTGNNAGTSDDGTKTSVGELTLDKGRIRIMGGGLHMPTEENDHRYGLKDYSLTYSGLYILENSMKHDSPDLGRVAATAGTRFTFSNTRSGQYTDTVDLGAVLTDDSGAPVAGELVTFTLSSDGVSESWTGVTGTDGTVTVPARLLVQPGHYALEARFEGRPGAYAATSALTTFLVEKEDTTILLSKKGKRTKPGRRVKTRLVAVLIDADDRDRGVASVPIVFRGRKAGVLGSSITDGNGKAVFKIKRRYWRKRTFRAVYNGVRDTYWNSSTIKVVGWRRRR